MTAKWPACKYQLKYKAVKNWRQKHVSFKASYQYCFQEPWATCRTDSTRYWSHEFMWTIRRIIIHYLPGETATRKRLGGHRPRWPPKATESSGAVVVTELGTWLGTQSPNSRCSCTTTSADPPSSTYSTAYRLETSTAGAGLEEAHRWYNTSGYWTWKPRWEGEERQTSRSASCFEKPALSCSLL